MWIIDKIKEICDSNDDNTITDISSTFLENYINDYLMNYSIDNIDDSNNSNNQILQPIDKKITENIIIKLSKYIDI